MKAVVTLVALWPGLCLAVEMKCDIALPAAWDEVVNYLVGHEKVLLEACHTKMVGDDESRDLTANEPRLIDVSVPGRKPIRFKVIASEEIHKDHASWKLKLAEPGGGFESYVVSAYLSESKDGGTTSVHIVATAVAQPGKWRHGKVATGLSRMVRGFEGKMKEQFPGRAK